MVDVAIIGAGPAGIAAAIQLKRYDIEFMIFEKGKIGGLLRNANLVENYLGFPRGIRGRELVELFKEQLKNAGVKVQFEMVRELDYSGKFFIRADRERDCRVAIIASGTKPREYPVPSDVKDRVFYEVDQISTVSDEKVAIIGAGDAAFDYAINLSRENEVTILNRSNRVRCLPILWRRAMECEKISYRNAQVKNIKSHGDGLMITCGGEFLYARYLLIAIGREPCLDFLSQNLTERYEKLQKVNVLYLVGDVKNNIYRQTAMSVGDGIRAAMEIDRNFGKGP